MATYQSVYNATIETTRYILDSVSVDGSWGTVDFADWGPIITALNVDHLLLCGLAIEEEWTVINDSSTFQCSLKKCLDYLANNVNEDGSFGADFWDTCKLATIVVEHSLQGYFDYEKINAYILQYVRDGRLQIHTDEYSRSTEWSGPGTYAACVSYLLNVKEIDLANSVLSDALDLQQNDGSFVGKKARTGDNLIHPIWHTAQMLRVLLKSKYQNNADLIDKIVHWMESIQGAGGEFDNFGQYIIYYTAYGALAYLALPNTPQPYTERAIDFLLSKSQNGKYDDFGGTIMVAQVFEAYLRSNDLQNIYRDIQMKQAQKLLLEVKQLRAQIEQQSKQISEYAIQIQEYKDRYKDADIILSKKDVWKFSIVFGFVTLLLGIIVPVLINVIVAIMTTPTLPT